MTHWHRGLFKELNPGDQFTLDVKPTNIRKYIRIVGLTVEGRRYMELNAVDMKTGVLETFDEMQTIFTINEE